VFNEGRVNAAPTIVGVNISGGKVTNGTPSYEGAVIKGLSGVYLSTFGSVVNYGTIEGIVSYTRAGTGVVVFSLPAGEIRNGSAADRTALIEGYTGVLVNHGEAGVLNYGTILGSVQYGVQFLDAAGQLTNGSPADTGATILGATSGVQLGAAANSLVNYGVIEGDGVGSDAVAATDYARITNYGTLRAIDDRSYAIFLHAGGRVTNGGATDRTALVEGFGGIFLDGAGTIRNAGTILGTGGLGGGVQLQDAGTLINGAVNNPDALIQGSSGAYLLASSGTNFGTINGVGEGELDDGVRLSGSDFTNGASGDAAAVIEGYTGVYAYKGAVTLTNFGTVIGEGGAAVSFNIATAELIVEAGSSFVGSVDGDDGTLDLASGVGTISGLSSGGDVTVSGSMATTTFDDFGKLEVGVGASFTLTGTDTTSVGQSLIDDGTLKVTGALTSAGTLGGTGTVDFTTGSDALTGGTLSVADLNVTGATVTLSGKIAVPSVVTVSGKLLVANGTSLTGAGAIVLTDSASNEITGTTATSLLTNDIRIEGEGQLGAGAMELTNASSGSIYSLGAGVLTVNTGTGAIINAGAIVSEGTGGLTISSPIDNTGALIAYSSPLTVSGAVTGAGTAEVENAASLVLKGAFNENVTFASGSTGTLELGDSKGYTTGSITGFSKTGTNALDLLDIPFVSGTTTATYSGTTTSGVLTVKDGANVATIHLTGNYTTSTFTVSSSSAGGTKVVDPALPLAPPHVAAPLSPHPFIAAMAGFGAPEAASAALDVALRHAPPPMVALPRAPMA
jgi:hypothetical protein